jgi:hypothetical protein
MCPTGVIGRIAPQNVTVDQGMNEKSFKKNTKMH